jgi:hypothetical protein
MAFSLLPWYSHGLILTNAECMEPRVVGPPAMWSMSRAYDVPLMVGADRQG